MVTQTSILTDADMHAAVSWKAVIAGAAAAAALTLVLIAFGVGVGFSVISPWAGEGLSATTFSISAGIYLIVVAMLASTVGGYLAGRLRSRWETVHEHERYFRDSAHGFLVWAVATLASAAVLGGATTHIIAGASAGLAPASAVAAQSAPTDRYVDSLLRRSPGLSPSPDNTGGDRIRGEVSRILASGLTGSSDVAAEDRAYLAQIVAERSGLSQPEAEARVSQVVSEAKAAADAARKATASLALWLAASMFAGALSGALAAIEGGNLRNREWYLTDGKGAHIAS